jgi:tRNA threonylcarbamoyladenosine biosynthesis protein TsaB
VLTLAVDTSTLAGSLAILRDERVLGVVSTASGETYSSRMFRHLRFLLDELNLNLDQFDLFAVAAGPGSFTGLRVGLAAVKGWAEVYRKPIAAISALEAVAAQARSTAPVLVPVIDARRGQIYGAVYEQRDGQRQRRGDELVLAPAELLGHLAAAGCGGDCCFVTPTPEVLAGALAQSEFRGRPVETVSAVLAPVIGVLGVARARLGDLVDALHLDANYVRRSDPELLWRG